MTDDEVVLEMYKIQIQRSEHYENQRASVTNVVMTLSAALLALATFDNMLTRADSLNGLVTALLGAFGLIATRLHGKRSRDHGKRASEYRNSLDQRLPAANINATRNLVPYRQTHLYRVWEGLHLAVVIIGLLLFALALRKPS